MFTDHLSRNMVNGSESNETALGIDCMCIATISEELNVSCTRLETVCEATACDLNMEALIHIIIQEWPNTMAKITNPVVRDIGPTMMSCLR